MGTSHGLCERPLSPSRFSQMVQDKPLRTSWQRKMKERQERKLAREFARHLDEEKERRRQVSGRPARPRQEGRGRSRTCPGAGWLGREPSLSLRALTRQGAWAEAEVRSGPQGGEAQCNIQLSLGLCERLKDGEEAQEETPMPLTGGRSTQ